MIPYFLLLTISLTFPLVYYRTDAPRPLNLNSVIVKKRTQMSIVIFFIFWFVLLSLRDLSVGNDLLVYKEMFNVCADTKIKNLPDLKWELGYLVYNKLISYITMDYRTFLIITAGITLFPMCMLFVREKKFSILLIALFINMPCFLMPFSGLRQAIAVSIGVFVYMAIEKKKYVLSAVLILLAFSFHVSALVLVLLYPAFFLKIKTKHMLFIVPILMVIYVLRIPLLAFIINFLPEHYVESYGDIEPTGAVGMMMLFLIFLIFSFVMLDENVMTKKGYYLRNILLIATVFQFFVPIHGLVQRASYYFLLFVPVSIVSVVESPKASLKKVSDIAVLVMSCFFLAYFFYTAKFSTDNLLNVFPYKFFWSGRGW